MWPLRQKVAISHDITAGKNKGSLSGGRFYKQVTHYLVTPLRARIVFDYENEDEEDYGRRSMARGGNEFVCAPGIFVALNRRSR